MSVHKQEFKYIAISVAFAVAYFFFALPRLIETFDGNNPIMQFFVFNLGILIFFTIYLKSRTLGKGINISKAIEYLAMVMALDLWLPEFHVDILSGELIQGGILGLSTTDYFFGYIGQNFLHLSGILVSIWTYAIVPTLLLYLAARISKSNFVRSI